MAGKFGPGRDYAEIGHDSSVAPLSAVRTRTECLIQLLGAINDIADFDDIHQAAERLDAVQAWIRREARAAAADLAFDDEAGALHVAQVTAA